MNLAMDPVIRLSAARHNASVPNDYCTRRFAGMYFHILDTDLNGLTIVVQKAVLFRIDYWLNFPTRSVIQRVDTPRSITSCLEKNTMELKWNP
jgi:hypothetical protein